MPLDHDSLNTTWKRNARSKSVLLEKLSDYICWYSTADKLADPLLLEIYMFIKAGVLVLLPANTCLT